MEDIKTLRARYEQAKKELDGALAGAIKEAARNNGEMRFDGEHADDIEKGCGWLTVLKGNDEQEHVLAILARKDKDDPLIETEDGDRPLSGVWDTADLVGLYEATEAWQRLTDEKTTKSNKMQQTAKNK